MAIPGLYQYVQVLSLSLSLSLSFSLSGLVSAIKFYMLM
jgi:hypothetical protein